MTLEQLVPTLEICQQLKAAGVSQDTAFKWCRLTRLSDTADGTCEYSINTDAENYYVPAEEVCAAPTAEEILKEFPSADIRCDRITLWGPTCDEPDWDVRYDKVDGVSDSLVNAAAHAFLWWEKEVAG